MNPEKIIEKQRQAQAANVLNMWTIYDHPVDFPHSYLARRFEIGGGREPIATEDIVQGGLEILREGFRRAGLVCLQRSPGDEPQIIETWL